MKHWAKRSVLFFVGWAVLFTSACGGGSSNNEPQASPPPPPVLAAIVGQVVGAPEMGISFPNGAIVTIIGHPEFTTQTDADGNFRIEGVPPGDYTLSIKAIDNNNAEVTDYITVTVGGNEVQLGTFTIVQTGAIRGTVHLEGGANLLGTLVYIPGTSFAAYTDDDGYFIIIYIPQGTYRLHFQRDGYAPDDITGIVVSMADVTDVGTLTLLTDGDGDEIADSADNCPLVSNFDQLNTDGDLYGNVCDDDDDNDGWTDAQEAIEGTDPLDTDTDDDLVNDPADNCPITSNTDQLDTDTDGDGNACDNDDDNDGLTDVQEAAIGTDPLDSDTDDDGLIDSVDPAPLVPGVYPHWTSEPVDIVARTGMCDGSGIQFDIDPFNEGVEISFPPCSPYQRINGIAADSDLPNTNPGDIGYLTCGAANSTCSFSVAVTGSGAGAVSCQIEFSTGAIPEVCNVDVVVADGRGLSISKTISIQTVDYPGAWYVDADATGAGDGTSWVDAFNHPRDAMELAVAGEAVWVAEGVYHQTGGNGAPVLIMKDGVEIYGGFTGTELSLAERGNPADHPTVLDSQDMSYHVVIGASNARLDGFTITRGNGVGPAGSSDDYAGGMYNNNVSNVIVTNCIFTYNAAKTYGGGIVNRFSSALIDNCVFDHNSTASTPGGAGGAIAHTGTSSVVIRNCVFTNNTAQNGGGVYDASTSHSSILNSTFTGNNATSTGGAITDYGAPSSITKCLFSNNSATTYGGAIYGDTASAVVNYYVTNCIFKNNTASRGGAFYQYHGYPVITNSTVYGNSATSYGGAMYNTGSGAAQLVNTIVWGNTSPSYPGLRQSSGTITVTYSDIQSGWTGTGNINADPRLISATDLHLLGNSPCINAGTSGGAPSDDFDGNPRPSVGDTGFDMGAYEFPIAASINCSNPGPNPVNELASMQCAVTSNFSSPVVNTATDTCGGTITGAGPWMYNFTPSESRGPGTCVASVKFGTSFIRSDTVTVLEINVPPVDHAPAAVVGRVDYFTFFNINPTDPDIPSQALTCVIESATGECVNGTLNGCAWSWTPTPAQALTECDVVTKVYDGVQYSAAVTTHVTINGIDQSPSVVVDCPDSMNEDESTTCALTATDPDIPPQALTCSKNSATTCTGVLVNGCTDVFVPAQGEVAGPGSCMVVVDVVDDFVPPAVGQGGDILNILEVNSAPHWSTAPSNLYVTFNQSYDRISGHALDEDMPNASSGDNGFIVCSAANNTCSFLVDIYGSGAGAADCRINFSTGPGTEICSVDVIATDGKGLNVSKTISINVNPFLGIWLVDADATGAGNGTSWADAFTTVQNAVNQAVAGEMVWVAEGNYKRPGGSPTTQSVLVMKSGVNIYGGFAGTELALSSRGNPADHPTILDGQNTSYHVVLGASNSSLNGFTITGGNANSTGDNGMGGGLFNKDIANISITKCVFSGNNVTSNGGGIYNTTSSITMTECNVSSNTASVAGGGVYNYKTTGTISKCLLNANTVTGTSTSCGGGGIVLNASPMTITDCVITLNYCGYQGAGIYDVYDTSSSAYSTITNSIISGNTATLGAGVLLWHTYPRIINCTIASNSATGALGGGGMWNDGPGYPTITNSIIWGNTASTAPGIKNQSGTVTATYSDIQGGYSGTGNINANPLFAGLTDLHLLNGSPCINSGTATGAPGADLDGNPRPSPVGGAFDMGAYEYQWP